MSGLNISQRIWHFADSQIQRAVDGIANTYDDTVRKLNKAFDFSDKLLNVRVPATIQTLTVQALTATNASAQNVTASQKVTAQNVVSAQGFKTVIGPWQRSNSAAFATTPTGLLWGVDTGTASTTLAFGFYAPTAGSIQSVTVAGTCGTATTLTVTAYKNLAATAAVTSLALVATPAYSTSTFAKGAVPFVAGDRLELYYSASAANTGQFVASFTIELAS